jgi:hypothetical protein
MKIHKKPEGIWKEYQRGVEYNIAVDLFGTVEENENFYIGRQWEGVNAPDLQKPVLNILKRAVSYYVATICSDDVGAALVPFHEDGETSALMRSVSNEIERVMEQDGTKGKFRTCVRNACVDGDGCLYFYFDPNEKTGQAAEGEIHTEIIENINVIFGNPYEHNVQKQPYIILAQRKPVGEVIDEAKENGIANADELIVPDSDSNQGEKGENNELCTVLIKLWKEKGVVHAIKTTEQCVVRKEWTPGNERYPVAWLRMELVRKSYHGEALISGLIQNQISINKLFAMYIRSVEMNAFPKIVYDKTKMPRGWSNRVGEAIGITGDVSQAAVNVLRGGDVSSQVMEVIQTCITLTRDCLGATDAALGNVRAEQAAASAIIATQQASEAPIEIQRRLFFDFVEESIRIILDLMCAHYGTRQIKSEEQTIDPMGNPKTDTIMQGVDFEALKNQVQYVDVRVGSSAYWSELMQMQTMDNLLNSGIIQDAALYLESIPDKWLPNKQKLIDSVKQTQEQQAGMVDPMAMPEQTAQSFDQMLA